MVVSLAEGILLIRSSVLQNGRRDNVRILASMIAIACSEFYPARGSQLQTNRTITDSEPQYASKARAPPLQLLQYVCGSC